MKLMPSDAFTWKYWLHLLLNVLIIYFLVNKFVSPMDITPMNIALGTLFLGIADISVHSLLRLE